MTLVALGLWSINERMAGRPGVDFPMLPLDWQDDLCRYAIEQAQATDRAMDEMDRNLSDLRNQR